MAKRKLVLTVLGGGSYFTPSFIGTMVQKPEIWSDCELRLQDPDAERVRLVQAFGERYAKRKGLPLTIVSRPRLDAALDGADFVIATFRIGGVKSLHLDESIPPRFGYFGDETAGPGGMFMAIRTVPVVMDVAQRMARLCPKAWLLNYANPTHFNVAGVLRTTKTRIFGLCDNYVAPMGDLGVLLGIKDYRAIVARHAGYNHCNWVYSAEYQGRDLLAELRRVKPAVLAKRIALLSERGQFLMPLALAMFELTGWFPVCPSHSIPYFFHREFLARQLARGGKGGHARIARHEQEKWALLKSQLREYRDEVADQVARTQHGGAHADLAIGAAAAIAADSGAAYPVNARNRAAVPGFPSDSVNEYFAHLGRNDWRPVKVPPFPPFIQAHQEQLFAYLDLVVQGILEKNRAKFLQALLLHPFTSSATQARELFAAMWREEREVLGDYWRGVR